MEEVEGDLIDEDLGEDDPANDPRWREMFELMQATPPVWVRAVEWVCMGLGALILAVTIFAQWVLWLIVTMAIWNPWSVILGIAICAAQMLLIFGRKADKGSCEIPK